MALALEQAHLALHAVEFQRSEHLQALGQRTVVVLVGVDEQRGRGCVAGMLPGGKNICIEVQRIVEAAAEFHKECTYPLPEEDFREVIRNSAHSMDLDQARRFIISLNMSYQLVTSKNMVNQIYEYADKNTVKSLGEKISEAARKSADRLDSWEKIDEAIDEMDLSGQGSGLVQKYSNELIRDAWDDTPGRALTEIEKECLKDTLEASLEICAIYVETVNGRIPSIDRTTNAETVAYLYMCDYELDQARRMLDENEIDYDAYAAKRRRIASVYAYRTALAWAYGPSVVIAGVITALCILVEAPLFLWAICALYVAMFHFGVFSEWREEFLGMESEFYFDKLESLHKKSEKKRVKAFEKQQLRLHN